MPAAAQVGLIFKLYLFIKKDPIRIYFPYNYETKIIKNKTLNVRCIFLQKPLCPYFKF